MKVITLLKQKLDFFTRKDRCKKPRILYNLKMCNEVFFSNYTLKQKWTSPANIRLDEVSRRRQDIFRLRLQKTSSRRLQVIFIKTNIFALALIFRRRLQDVLVKTNIFVIAVRLQDVFKMFSRRLQGVLPKHRRDVLKTSFSRRPAKTSSRRLQHIFKKS